MYLVAACTETSTPCSNGAEPERGRPGVVEHHYRAARVGRRGDRGDVLDLEGQRSRRLGEHDRRRRAQQRGDARADERIVVGDVDAEASQVKVAETARRPVDRIDHQHVVARLGECEQRQRRRREAGRDGERRVAALQLRDRGLQVGDRRHAVQPVGRLRRLPERRGLERGHRREENRRGPVDRRVDRAEVARRVAPEVPGERGRREALAIMPVAYWTTTLRPVALRARFALGAAVRAHRGAALASPSAARIASTFSARGIRTSMTIASAGGSSVANWLASSDAGM